MRRGGPPAHSAATPKYVELPGQLSGTEIPNIWERDCLECIEPPRTRPPRTGILTDGRNQNLAIGVEQPPLIILAPPEAPATSGSSLSALGRSRAPVRDADADNNAGDRKCLGLAQAM
jgi:hypothetical protein